MPDTYKIMEYRQDKPVTLHTITVPGIVESGGYRAILTIEAFKYFWMKQRFRFNEAGLPKPRSKLSKEVYFSVRREHCDGAFPAFNVSIETHNSIWDFYDSIQWNHKTKKFRK